MNRLKGLSVIAWGVALVVFFAGFTTGMSAATRSSASSGNWSNPNIWNPVGVPAAGDVITIKSGTSVVIDVATEAVDRLVIEPGATLSGDGQGNVLLIGHGGGEDLTNNGVLNGTGSSLMNIQLNASSQWGGIGTYQCSYILLNSNTLSFTAGNALTLNVTGAPEPFVPPGTLSPGTSMSVRYCGTDAQDLSSRSTVRFNNLVIANPAGVTLRKNLDATSCSGNLTIESGSSLNTVRGTSVYSITGTSGHSLVLQDGARLVIAGAGAAAGSFPAGYGTNVLVQTSIIEYQNNSSVPMIVSSAPTYGCISLTGTGAIMLPAGRIRCTGDFSNSSAGTVTASANDTLAFVGSGSSQALGGSSQTTFRNLLVDNSLGCMLGQPATVAGTLILQNGLLTTGSNTLTVSQGGSVSRTSGHVNGLLRCYAAAGTTTTLFDVGDNQSYSPISVVAHSVTTPGYLTVSTTGSEHPEIASSLINPSNDVNRYWTVDGAGVVASAYDVTPVFVPSDLDASAVPASFFGSVYNGASWTLAAAGSRTGLSTQLTGLTSLGDIVLGDIMQYVITASANSGGTLSPSGTIPVVKGNDRSFTITPSTGYHIDSLLVDGNTVAPATSYTFPAVSEDHSIRVVFAIDRFILTASSGPNGTITPSGPVTVDFGTTQAFTLTPATGYHVDSLVVDGVVQPVAGTYTFSSVHADHTIRAAFAIDRFTVTAAGGANGTVAPSGTIMLDYGSNQTVTFTPSVGYHVDTLLVDGTLHAAASSWTFSSISANHTVIVTFAIDRFTVTASAGPNGTITPSGVIPADYGSAHTFNVTPETGYHIDSLVVDGSTITPAPTYSFPSVTSNHTIHAAFAIDRFTITASAGANGAISPSGSVSADYGSNPTFTFTPQAGAHVDSLVVDGVPMTPALSYTFSAVSADHTLRVVFRTDQFIIQATANAGGTISPAGSVNTEYGTDQVFTLTPSVGYHLDSLFIDGISAAPVLSHTFTAVSADHSIRGVFAINRYTINVTSSGPGTATPAGNVVVTYGSSQSVSLVPQAGAHVDSLVVDGVSVTPSQSYIFSPVTADHSLRVVFSPDRFTVYESAGPNGTVTPSGDVVLDYGSTQVFTFTPAGGYHVDSLIVDGVSQAPALTWTFGSITASHSLRVSFAVDQFTITVTSGSNGSVSPSGVIGMSSGGFQTIQALPAAGYHVDSLVVDGFSMPPALSYTFTTVTANHTIRFAFAINQYTITASAGANGAVSPSGSAVVNYGDSRTYTITPSQGYHVDSLVIDGSLLTAAPSYTFTAVNASHVIRVTFAIDQFTITASAGANGAISPSGVIGMSYGDSQSFTFIPATGYHVDSIVVDGSLVPAAPGFTFSAVTESHTIRVTFAINQYQITSVAGPNGTITPSGSVSVAHGGSQSYAIAPAAGYHVDSVVVDNVLQAPALTYAFTGVVSAHSIRVVFAINWYTITATVKGNGSISPPGIIPVSYGGNQSFTITPATGAHLDSLFVDGVSVPVGASYSFINVSANHALRAVFASAKFTVAASAGLHGAITPAGDVQVSYGDDQGFFITADEGYHPDSLYIDGIAVGIVSPYTFTNVTLAHSIRATFAINHFTLTVSAGDHGSVAPSGTLTVSYWSNQTFTMVPDQGYVVDSILVDGQYAGNMLSYTFMHVAASHELVVKFKETPANLVQYRTFSYEDLLMKKGLKKKAIAEYWEFAIVNTTSDVISEINAHFTKEVVDMGRMTRMNMVRTKRTVQLTGGLAPGDTVILTGRSRPGHPQQVDKLWFGPVVKFPTLTKVDPTLDRMELPLPNMANVRDEAFSTGAFSETNGILVGVRSPNEASSCGWVRIAKSTDMYNSMVDRTGPHVGPVRGFDVLSNGRPFVREQRSLPPSKQNNRMFADLLTLKFNIGLSDMGITEPGFGELVYDDPTSSFSGMMVRDIAQAADSAVTYRLPERGGYVALDTVLMRLNASFRGTLDTVSWGERIILTGTRMLQDVNFLSAGTMLPHRAHPVAAGMPPADPVTFALGQNYPNPFNPTTTIAFDLPVQSVVTLKVYNLIGQEITTLADRELMGAGTQETEFTASGLASGVYFYRIIAEPVQDDESVRAAGGVYTMVKKMLLVR